MALMSSEDALHEAIRQLESQIEVLDKENTHLRTAVNELHENKQYLRTVMNLIETLIEKGVI